MTTDEIEIQQQRINHWLRHHIDYQVTIHLNTIYGCIGVQITKNGEHVKGYIGTSLKKRFDQVIKYLEIDTWEGPYNLHNSLPSPCVTSANN